MDTKEIDIWTRLNECEAVKKVKGNWLPGDNFITPSGVIYTIGDGTLVTGNCRWVIPLYDPIHPARSLVGMVTAHSMSIFMDSDGRWAVFTYDGRRGEGHEAFIDRPDLLLWLKS